MAGSCSAAIGKEYPRGVRMLIEPTRIVFFFFKGHVLGHLLVYRVSRL